MITRTINVLGVGISEIDLNRTTSKILEGVNQGIQGYVCVTGVHGVSEAQDSQELRKILNNSFLNTPDGMPMVWMGRIQGSKIIRRVYGPDLMLEMFRLSEQHGLKHFFYGGGDGVAERLKRELVQKFPKAQIVGIYTPPFRPLSKIEELELLNKIKLCDPDLVWVGLSTPKQERFMANFLSDYGDMSNCEGALTGPKVFLGVGAAFDFHAGLVRQAPRWLQSLGLEWLFRLLMEPRRLWKRYLANNPKFIVRAIMQLTGLRSYSST